MQITESLENALREVLIRSGIGGLRSIIQHTQISNREDDILKQLLRALEMNESSAADLRALLSGTGKKSSAEILKELRQILSDSPASSVITEEMLGNPEALAKQLSASLSSEDLKVILAKLEALAGQSKGGSPESLKDLEKVLVRLMREQGEDAGHPLKKLANLLRALPRVSEALINHGEKLLDTVLRGQVESFKAIEIHPRAALIPLMTDNPVEMLLATLQKAWQSVSAPATDLEKQFVAFTKALYAELQKMMTQGTPELSEIKLLMERAVQTIEHDFMTSIFSAPQPVSDDEVSLPHKAQVLLKSIEAQLTTLLTMPDDDLLQLFNPSTKDGETSEGVKRLLPLIENLRMLGAQLKPEAQEAFRARLDSITSKVTRLVDQEMRPEMIREALHNVLREIQLEMHAMTNPARPGPVPPVVEQIRRIEREIYRVLEGFREMVNLPEPEKKNSIPMVQQAFREMAAYREQEIMQHLHPGQQQMERLEQHALLLKDPNVLLVLRMLKSADFSGLFGTGSNFEKQFVDFLKELAQRMPGREAGNSRENPSRRQLEEGLSRLEQQFRSEKQGLHDPKAAQLRNVMAAVEQIFRGQELLERLNPLMNLLGEPAFLLFPSIIHGFASQIEMITYPEPPEEEDDESGKGKSGRSKRSYKRFEFDMQFQGMGRIQSRVLFREGEFILDLTSESEGVASFLEERLPKFEALIQLMGYEKVELRVTAAPFVDLKPSWVPAMLGVWAMKSG